MIAVIVNPRSRANRRNPQIAADFQAIVGDQGRVVRVARGGAKDRFPGMGLEFIDLSPDDRAAIARLT